MMIFNYIKKYYFYGLGLILLMTLVFRFASPVKDGDFFWHVQYGKYMVEHRTLVPDHTIYSWTSADNSAIKCNWIADIGLYLINQAGGLPLLFALRYLCFFILMGTIWIYAKKIKQEKDAFLFFVLIVVLLSSYGASFLKPEIISMLFFAFLSGIYFSVKSSLWGKWKTKPFLFYPVLFFLWANIHEVFIFGLVLLGLITVGELLNSRVSLKTAFSKDGIRHLVIGALLSLAAVFINPYGYQFIFKFGHLLTAQKNIGFQTVNAYQSIFTDSFYLMHYLDFWIIMIFFFGLFFFLFVKNRYEIDWGISLPTIFLAIIFVRYARATYYWPVFWGMSIIYLKNKYGSFNYIKPLLRSAAKTGFVVLFLFLSLRAMHDARYDPFMNQWFGFGIGYANPVQSSTFLKEHRPGKLLYNSYGAGGYLLYDLHPLYKVFIDPRYFPYKNWFAEYNQFHTGSTTIEEFRRKYPFDMALLDYNSSPDAINKFILSKEWIPVFYGPSAVIFLKKNADFTDYNLSKLDKNRFNDLHTLHQAYTVFIAAQNLGDLETSKYILSLIREKFSFHNQYRKIVNVCTLYQDGLDAMAAGDYETAFSRLSILGLNSYKIRANNALIKLRNWKAKQFVQKGEYAKAMNLFKATLKVIPQHKTTLYNAGIIGYMLDDQKKSGMLQQKNQGHEIMVKTGEGKTTNRHNYLERFLALAPEHPCAKIAKQVISGHGLPKEVPIAY